MDKIPDNELPKKKPADLIDKIKGGDVTATIEESDSSVEPYQDFTFWIEHGWLQFDHQIYALSAITAIEIWQNSASDKTWIRIYAGGQEHENEIDYEEAKVLIHRVGLYQR